jgi:hypothetical protein
MAGAESTMPTARPVETPRLPRSLVDCDEVGIQAVFRNSRAGNSSDMMVDLVRRVVWSVAASVTFSALLVVDVVNGEVFPCLRRVGP